MQDEPCHGYSWAGVQGWLAPGLFDPICIIMQLYNYSILAQNPRLEGIAATMDFNEREVFSVAFEVYHDIKHRKSTFKPRVDEIAKILNYLETSPSPHPSKCADGEKKRGATYVPS